MSTDNTQRQASKSGPTLAERRIAAQIRVKIDRKDRIETPTWIKELAEPADTLREDWTAAS
jgi:hypothetical protein